MRYTQKNPQHTYTKRDVYYFSRVIPNDLRNHYTKPRIIQSLKTKSAHRASVASKMLSSKLDNRKCSSDIKDKSTNMMMLQKNNSCMKRLLSPSVFCNGS